MENERQKQPEFIPLALHTAYTFGHGVNMPATVARVLAAKGHRGLPLTDSLSFSGLVHCLKAAQAFGLQPFPGIHVPVAHGEALLFPSDERGFRSICHFVTRCHSQGFLLNDVTWPRDLQSSAPAGGRGDWCATSVSELFQGLCGGIRAIGIGPGGLKALEMTGQGVRRYWGITRNCNLREIGQEEVLAKSLGASPVAVPRLTHAGKSDRLLLQILKAIHFCKSLEQIRHEPEFGDHVSASLSPETMEACWSWFPESIAGNKSFGMEPCWVPPLGTHFMPRVLPDPRDSQKELWRLTQAGLRRKYLPMTPEVQERFRREFEVIAQKDFADYFLAVHEIVKEAERRGHRVLGRGSAANSIVSYALDITHVDPIRYGLFFERFLNPERSSPPDIDLDFSWRLRDSIYEFLKSRWGEDRVAMISTHVTLGGRGALRETAKALGYPFKDMADFSRAIGWRSVRAFLANPAGEPDLQRYMPQDRKFLTVLKFAAQLEGLPTHLSLHAGGVVIAPDSLSRFTPCQPSSKALPVTQMEMHAIEDLGLVKIDLLAQRSLGVFADVTQALEKKGRVPAILQYVEGLAADRAVNYALRRGNTMGVFYIESPGMRSLLRKLDCQGFLNLVAASSVIRPGVAESGMMQEYILRHRHPERRPRLHPIIGGLLHETHGVMVYQEDVIRVANAMGNLSLAEGDVLRRIMSGKNKADRTFAGLREKFMDGARGNGVSAELAELTWRQMESFSGYAFCKAHSASYAVLSLQLLWLKCRYPARFMAAVLDNGGGFYGPYAYVSEARRLGVAVLPPDVDLGDWNCVVHDEKNTLMLGFSFVKNLSRETWNRLDGARQERPFTDLHDFLQRVRPGTDEYENLVSCGALQRFGPPAVLRWEWFFREKNPGLFSQELSLPAFTRDLPDRYERAKMELASLGLMLSAHPLEFFDIPKGVIRSKRLPFMVNRPVMCAGALIAWKPVTTKKHEKMKFITLEDHDGLFEVTLFPDCHREYGHLLYHGSVFIAEGIVESEMGVSAITARKILLPREAPRLKVPGEKIAAA